MTTKKTHRLPSRSERVVDSMDPATIINVLHDRVQALERHLLTLSADTQRSQNSQSL